MQIDDIDCQILDALQCEGRIRNKDMADRIGLSQSACLDRTRRLERIGVIIGYKAMLNHAALGAPLEVWGEVTLTENSPAALARFSDLLHRTPAVVSAYRVAGRQDFLLHAHVSSIAIWDGVVQSANDAGLDIVRATASVVVERVKDGPLTLSPTPSLRLVENTA